MSGLDKPAVISKVVYLAAPSEVMPSPSYWAGLFDGEGCVRLNRQHPVAEGGGSYLRVSVVNAHRGVLATLQEQFGGSLLPHNKPGPRHKQAWTWVATTNKAEAFLRTVLPFLVIKRDQALIGRAFQGARNKNIRVMDEAETSLREGFFQQLHRAKHGTGAS